MAVNQDLEKFEKVPPIGSRLKQLIDTLHLSKTKLSVRMGMFELCHE
jgi:hypothetical protein